MKNFKRNMWSKIFMIFSIFSFVTFLNNTTAFAQAAARPDSERTAAPQLKGDLGGKEALPKSENLPGDGSSGEELLRKSAGPQGAVSTAAPSGTDLPVADIFAGPPKGGEEPKLEQTLPPEIEIPADLAKPDAGLPETEKAVADAPVLGEASAPAGEVSGELAVPAGETPALGDTAVPEGGFVLASPEDQKILKEEVAKLLVEEDTATAQIIQEQLTKAIGDGTIVLGEQAPAGEAGAVDAKATDEAVATLTTQVLADPGAQKKVLDNLSALTKTLQSAPAAGTPGAGTAVPTEALKGIDALQKAITSGNQKSIEAAMKNAMETFKSFGPGTDMGMAGFGGGPKGDFGPGGGAGGGFFDKAFAGAVPQEMMKTFSEGPGKGFDRGQIAGEFMAKVGSDMISKMAGEKGMQPNDVFQEMAKMGFSPDSMLKSAEKFQEDMKNNPGAFGGQMGPGPMGGPGEGVFRGPAGKEGFSPTQPPGGWTTVTSELQAKNQGVDLFGPAGAAPKEYGLAGGPREFFGGFTPRETTVFEIPNRQDYVDFKSFVPTAALTPEQAARNLVSSLRAGGMSNADITSMISSAYGSVIVTLLRADSTLPTPTPTPTPTSTPTPSGPVYPGDAAIVAGISSAVHNLDGTHTITYTKSLINSTALATYINNTIPASPNITLLGNGNSQLVIKWTGQTLTDINGRRIDNNLTHTNEPPSGPTQAQINAADKQLYLERYKVSSAQTAGTNWGTWLGQQNVTQAIRDSVRNTVQTQSLDGVTSAQELADKRAAFTQLQTDIAEGRAPNCHSQQLHDDPDIGVGKPEHDSLLQAIPHCN